MSKSGEYRQYAEECMESARAATSDEARQRFIEIAKLWLTAAQQIDDGFEAPIAPNDNSRI